MSHRNKMQALYIYINFSSSQIKHFLNLVVYFNISKIFEISEIYYYEISFQHVIQRVVIYKIFYIPFFIPSLWNPTEIYTICQFRQATFQMFNSHRWLMATAYMYLDSTDLDLFNYFAPFPHSVPGSAFAAPSLRRCVRGSLYPQPLLFLTQWSYPSHWGLLCKINSLTPVHPPYRVPISFHVILFPLYLSPPNIAYFLRACLIYCP